MIRDEDAGEQAADVELRPTGPDRTPDVDTHDSLLDVAPDQGAASSPGLSGGEEPVPPDRSQG